LLFLARRFGVCDWDWIGRVLRLEVYDGRYGGLVVFLVGSWIGWRMVLVGDMDRMASLTLYTSVLLVPVSIQVCSKISSLLHTFIAVSDLCSVAKRGKLHVFEFSMFRSTSII